MKSFPTFIFSLLTDLQFAITILGIIALTSSLGTVIEQDELLLFYQQNYPSTSPLYGFLDWKWIQFLGLDHIYSTPWFFFLIIWLACSLISCTFTNQFPLFLKSKKYKFQQDKRSFLTHPFFVTFPFFSSSQEVLLIELQKCSFSIYQKKQSLYGYKGLVGRLSPIFVHLSLLCILGGSLIGAFENFKAQELVPKNELFQIQNPIQSGWFTSYPSFSIRINDFWVDYTETKSANSNLSLEKKEISSSKDSQIHQFYSDLSVLEKNGKEKLHQTISVNNPIHYQGVDIYQSDWNLVGIRLGNQKENKRLELPLFPLPNKKKAWITWLPSSFFSKTSQGKNKSLIFSSFNNTKLITDVDLFSKEKGMILILDQFQQMVFLYNFEGNFQGKQTVGETLVSSWKLIEILPATGLLMKYDPSLPIIYTGFGLLMLMTFLSYLPFTQLWLVTPLSSRYGSWSWFGSSTNRGQIQLEIEFENLLRSFENQLGHHPFFFSSEVSLQQESSLFLKRK